MSTDSITTHGCSRINYIVFHYSEQFITNATPCFLRAVQFSFGLLCIAMCCSFLKINACFLRRYCLIWDIRSVNNRHLGHLVRFDKSKRRENKVSSRQRNPSHTRGYFDGSLINIHLQITLNTCSPPNVNYINMLRCSKGGGITLNLAVTTDPQSMDFPYGLNP